MEVPDYDVSLYFKNYSELVEDLYEIVDIIYFRITHYILNYKK